MGIQIEFNPDLALRRHGSQGKLVSECLPEELVQGNVHEFLKSGQRNFWLEGEIPLLETKGDQNLSRPLASVRIIESTHFLKEDRPFTKGLFRIIKVFDTNDPTIHFESYRRI